MGWKLNYTSSCNEFVCFWLVIIVMLTVSPLSIRCNVVDTSKERSELSHNFKALPLNRKVRCKTSLVELIKLFSRSYWWFLVQILSSKGDIGVFRNSKREITVPMVESIPYFNLWFVLQFGNSISFLCLFVLSYRNLISIQKRGFSIIHQLNFLTR